MHFLCIKKKKNNNPKAVLEPKLMLKTAKKNPSNYLLLFHVSSEKCYFLTFTLFKFRTLCYRVRCNNIQKFRKPDIFRRRFGHLKVILGPPCNATCCQLLVQAYTAEVILKLSSQNIHLRWTTWLWYYVTKSPKTKILLTITISY